MLSNGHDLMRRILEVWLVLALLGVPDLRGQDSPADLFARGNAEYRKGEFAAAERSYREMLNKGVDSGSLYYNLGNVCFKQKRLGEAIYFWEKARQKLPGDPDTQENLELANLLVVDRIEVPPDPFPLRVLQRIMSFLSIAQAAWTVLCLFILTNVLISVYLLATSARACLRALTVSLVTGALTLLLGCSLAWRIYDQDHRLEGIVVEQKAEVRSGPGVDNITIFTVHEGIKIRVRGEAGGWYQISLPNGWNGWMQATAVRVL